MPSFPIQLKRNGTAAATPSSLLHGEVALNYADGKLFWKDASNVIQSFTFQAYALSSHTHAASDITSGTLDAARLPLATTIAAGAVIVGTGLGVSSGTVSVTYGTTSGTACQGNDSRLSDTRTPTDGSVTTAKLANDAVTYAKLQNVSATDRLLGRSSAGAGDVEEITCTAFGRSLIDDADAAAARTTLSVQPTASPAFTGTVSAAAANFTGAVSVTSPLTLTGTVAGNVRQIKMQTSGVDRWQITPSFDAETGSNAGSNLHITRWNDAGSFMGTPLYITRSTGVVNCESGLTIVSGQLLVTAGSASACGVAFIGDPDTGIAQLSAAGANTLSICTNSAERVRVGSGGNVAIGAIDPQTALHIDKNADGALVILRGAQTANTQHILFRNPFHTNNGSAGTAFVGAQDTGSSGGNLIFATTTNGSGASGTPTERMRVDASGNVGIGVTPAASTTSNVQASGDITLYGASRGFLGNLYFQSGWKYAGTGHGWGWIEGSGNVDFARTSSSGTAGNTATLTTAIRINSGSEVLIGTTTDNGAYLLQVNSQIYATNATIATSDARFKTNVQALTDATAVIAALRPVAFDFIPHAERNFATERQVGLIAQEAQAALAGTDYADSVVAQCGDHLGLAYEKLVPVLIKALQESNARIAALEERLNHA